MSRDFNDDQGGIQSSSSTEFDPIAEGTPTTGFTESPKGEVKQGAPGAGIGNSRGAGIH
jgi:hypothetical protein